MADHQLTAQNPCFAALNSQVDAFIIQAAAGGSFVVGTHVRILSGDFAGRQGVVKENYHEHRWWVSFTGDQDRMIEEDKMQPIGAEAKGETLTLKHVVGASYITLFDKVAKAARKGEKGDDRLGQNLFSQQKPNFGDTLANYQHKVDMESGVKLFIDQLQNVDRLLEADASNLKKKMDKDAGVKSLYENLGKINDQQGQALREYIVASLNLAQRAMGVGRALIEVFERNGNDFLDELAKKLEIAGLKVLYTLGGRLLDLQTRETETKEHVLHAMMKVVADCYSHLALAVRYEAHYKMTKGKQDKQSLQKSLDLLQDGHNLCWISMKYRALAETPSRMTSSMNGFVQNTEFLYILDALAAHALKQERVYTELETLKKRTELWRMTGGTRWACVDGWGLLDTSRRLPNVYLRQAILEGQPDHQIKKVWTDGMRVRQMLLSLLLRPEGDVGYNRYPGFLAPITLAEMLHDIAEAEVMVNEAKSSMKLPFFSEGEAAMMCDILRDHFVVHGEVGNFFEEGEKKKLQNASPQSRETLLRKLMADQASKEDAVVLPTVPDNKFLSLSWSVVLKHDSPYLPVLTRVASALRNHTKKEHVLWAPGQNMAAALSLDDPSNAQAHELVKLVGYRDSGPDYITKQVSGAWVDQTASGPRIAKVGMWDQAINDDANAKVTLNGKPATSTSKSAQAAGNNDTPACCAGCVIA